MLRNICKQSGPGISVESVLKKKMIEGYGGKNLQKRKVLSIALTRRSSMHKRAVYRMMFVVWLTVGTCEASIFDSNSNRPFRFDSTVMDRFENFRIGRVCPLLVVVRRLQPLTALSSTVYRLASSMSYTPVLFNVFDALRIGMTPNEESVVRYISFVSFVNSFSRPNRLWA